MGIFGIFKSSKESKQSSQQEERLAVQRKQEYEQELLEIQNEIMSSTIIERCSEVIDAYCKLSTLDFFDMSVGNIWVVIPKPKFERLMGNLFASDEQIEIVFDAYYDCTMLPDMLSRGVQSLVAYGVPQILADKNVVVSINDQKVRWVVKTYPPARLYGIYNTVSFEERFEFIKCSIESKYTNLKSQYPMIGLNITPLAVQSNF